MLSKAGASLGFFWRDAKSRCGAHFLLANNLSRLISHEIGSFFRIERRDTVDQIDYTAVGKSQF